MVYVKRTKTVRNDAYPPAPAFLMPDLNCMPTVWLLLCQQYCTHDCTLILIEVKLGCCLLLLTPVRRTP